MKYNKKKHKKAFIKAIKRHDKRKKNLMAVIYLLTADFILWRSVQFAILTNTICFEEIKLRGLNDDSCILFCAARDLYLGSDCVTLNDLADKELISKEILILLNKAILIRRYGLDGWEKQKKQMNM